MAIREFGGTPSEGVHATPEQALLEQQKEIMAYGLQAITEKIEKKKSPFLERHAWGWRYEQLATRLKGEIQTIKDDLRDSRELKATIYDDVQKIKDLLLRPDVRHEDKAPARALETYYHNANTEKITRSDVETRRIGFLETYDRCVTTPDKIATLRDDTINRQLTSAQRTAVDTLHTRYTTDGRLNQNNYNQLETFHRQYVEHPRWFTELRQLDTLPAPQRQDLDRITSSFENHQQLNPADRARLQELSNDYLVLMTKLHELSENSAIQEDMRQAFQQMLDRKEYLRTDLITRADRDDIEGYHDKELTQRTMLQELSEISHLPDANHQQVEALRDAYMADEENRLGDINDPQRAQLQHLYDRFVAPQKQLDALEQKQHRLLITDSLMLEAYKAAFEQNGNLAGLNDLHERNVLIPDQLEALHSIISQDGSPLAREVSALSETFWNTSDLSATERTRLQEIYDNHIAIPEQLASLNKLNAISSTDVRKLMAFEQAVQLTTQEHEEFKDLHQTYITEPRPDLRPAEQRMNVLQKLDQQIKLAETTLSAKENSVREKQNKLVHGSPWVARKFYEWRTRDVRSTLESELTRIVNGERRSQTLPEAIKIVLLQLTSDTHKNKLKEIATAEAKVITHMTNARNNLEIINQRKNQLEEAQTAFTNAIRAEEPESQESLMQRVAAIKHIETNINYARKGYIRALNDPMLVHDFQNYQRSLYKNIYGPAKNAILTMYKINGLINIMGATETYLSTLGEVADARNSLLSKMVHLTGRGIENIPAGFSGGVGANVVKGIFTPYTVSGAH